MNKRIEICGGIAAGKTSLAQVLEKEGFLAIYERFEDNPFLRKFYMDSEEDNVFETEMVFALLHYNRIRRIEGENVVCDYSLLQDYCYAVNNLKKEEIGMFDNLYSYIIKRILPANLIIYLKCNVDCLLQRIKERNRKMEQNISKEYLQSNIDTIEKYLYSQNNILIIESDKYNFIKEDKDIVVEMVKKYYNNANDL